MTGRIHVVGIGGTGLSAIAKVLHERGESVSGSDQAPSPYAQALEALGVPVTYGHAAGNVAGARLVLVSSAVAANNPEVLAARQAGIPVLRREQYFRELTAGFRTVAVAGTHGKTTTTAMIAWILDQAGRDPSYIIGGVATDLGTNAHAGKGIEFIVEADEYDRAFLGLSPSVAVVTNIEHDHPDCYPTPEEFRAAFEAFSAQVQDLLIACADDPASASLAPVGPRRTTYGLRSPADWRATDLRPTPGSGSTFTAWHHDTRLGTVSLSQPGEHNVSNALGALAATDQLGTPFATSARALASFHGVGRRFEVLGEAGGVIVIDDYAHHPSEIRATLQAARQRFPRADVWAVFQPHTYSRTRALLASFAAAFADANHVLVTDIFAAREQPDGVTSAKGLVQVMRHPDARVVSTLDEALRVLAAEVEPGAVVVTLSAGDANRVGKDLLALRRANEEGVRRHG
jgi:UDP-N-acetylmuramate--alanine ligase